MVKASQVKSREQGAGSLRTVPALQPARDPKVDGARSMGNQALLRGAVGPDRGMSNQARLRGAGTLLQRKCAACDEKESVGVQRKTAGSPAAAVAPPNVAASLREIGAPLDAGARRFMEARFGRSFADVRVHHGSLANESARAVNARAYTVGRDIVFDEGMYEPSTHDGRRLIAHELTHVVQQGAGEQVVRRQPFPGVITRCRDMGVPCPAPREIQGQICRLRDCIPAATANLPFAISPGVCIYQCENGMVCACVLVGSKTSAVCTFTFCDSRGGDANAEMGDDEVQAFASRAVDAYSAQAGQEAGPAPTAQASLRVGAEDDPYEREADRVADAVMSGAARAPSLALGGARSAGGLQRLSMGSDCCSGQPGDADSMPETTSPAQPEPPQEEEVVQRTVDRRIQRDMRTNDPQSHLGGGGTLPYVEANEYATCMRIMNDATYCDREVLGITPTPAAPPPPPTCVPPGALAWADFTGSPPGGRFAANTAFNFSLVAAGSRQWVVATFNGAASGVRARAANPSNRATNGCASNVRGCEQHFDRETAAGHVGITFHLGPATGCAAAVQPDTTLLATKKDECSTVLGVECDSTAGLESDRLLHHEQLHFDLACAMAAKGNAAIAANPTGDAQPILNAVRTKASQQTALYDAQSAHGCNAAGQATWDAAVAAGLPAVTIP